MTVRPVGRTSTGERELRVQGAQACAPRAARSNAPVTVVLMPRTSRSKPFGPCSLCKQERQLTFEHIPPQAAGNTDPVWAQNMDQWLSAGPAYARKGQPRGRQQQRGAGGHLLCGECNSLLGTTLVPEYARWAGPVRKAFAKAKELVDWADRIPEQSLVEVGWAGRRPGVFARQALAMCLTAGRGLPEVRRHTALLAAIHTHDEQDTATLPSLQMRFYAGPQARMGPAQGWLKHTAAGWVSSVAWEVAYPPFAFSLTLAGVASEDDFDLRGWLALPSATTAGQVSLMAPLGFGHTPYFLDYRTRAAVARDAEEPAIPAPAQRFAMQPDVWTRFGVEPVKTCDVAFRLPGRWSLSL